MKRTLAILLTLALVMASVFALAACACSHVDENGDCICDKCGEAVHVDENGDGLCDKCGAAVESDIVVDSDLKGTYDISLWVSEKVLEDQSDSVVELTKRQIARFCKETGIKINPTVEGVTEADAGSKVVADVASAPDIYCFAQDQLARLVQAGALSAPGKKAQTYISNINDASAVNAAKVAGTLYAYPMTSDNGYFLYYDKSVVSNPDSLEKIIEDCEAAGKEFRFALENAWYTASFFFATGCSSNWTTDTEGKFTSVEDDFNSAKGLIAMKGMQKLASSSCYNSDADSFDDCAAIVTGTWNSGAATTYFGDNFGVTDLPSFTVGEEEYHLGSYSGFKFMGVKPQTDARKAAVLQLLAQYLTSDECQMERFEIFGWGPSSKISQDNDAVKADPSLAALSKQNIYAIPQPQIHGSWWDIAKVLGAEAKAATSEADLQTALDNYKGSIDALFQMSEEEKRAYTVIGGINDSGWNADFAMTVNADETVWTSEQAFTLNAGDEFKIRQGKSWDVAWGDNTSNADPSVPTSNKANYTVETAGTYYIVLTITDGVGVITLQPAQ